MMFRELDLLTSCWRRCRAGLAQTRDESGAVTTEYVILVALLAAAAIAAAGIIIAKILSKANSIPL
jgi:Flp pilus assembly pilin Flp